MPRISPVVVVPAAAALLGGIAIAISSRGAGERPWLAVPVLALAVAAALGPLRFGLPVAIGLAAFNGFLIDFVGWHAPSWNELFVAALVLRALARRLPSRAELVAWGAAAAIFLGYLVTGTKALAVFWGAKVLLLSVLAGWAIFRLRPARREWLASYYGLAVASGASVILAVWQRAEGVDGLRALGIPFGERIRTAEGGSLRAFAGFTSGSPFSYALAIACCCWGGLLLAEDRDRRIAIATAWLPAAALLGIALALDRTAMLALGAAALVAALREAAAGRLKGALVPTVTVAAAAVLAIAVFPGVLERFHVGSAHGRFRAQLWADYLDELSVFGAGPASAGSAYRKADPPRWTPPLQLTRGWRELYLDRGTPVNGMGTRGTIVVAAADVPRRPELVLRAEISSVFLTRRLDVRGPDVRATRALVRPNRWRPLAVAIRGGTGTASLGLRARPPASRVSGPTSALVAVRFRSLRVDGLPPPRSPTLRVYARAHERTRLGDPSVGTLAPGVVDNQYVTWLFEYGVLGALLGLAGLGTAVWLVLRRTADSAALAAGFVLTFVALTAMTVNVWEEAPTDLLTAIVVAHALAPTVRGGRRRFHGPRRGEDARGSAGLWQ